MYVLSGKAKSSATKQLRGVSKMANEIIERVASAIQKEYVNPLMTLDTLACAAIKAMREPTEPMILKGLEFSGYDNDPSNLLYAWELMIDEALK
jgi:hypothetical protein